MMCSGYISFFVYFVLFHKQVLGSCPQNCAVCSKNGDSQNCDECNYGHWLTEDSFCFSCPDNCKQCTNALRCTKCESNFWGINENRICGSPCRDSCTISGCNDETGHCFGCHPFFYGLHCDRSCDLCINKYCNRQRCTIGCIDGYYESTDNGIECKKCNNHCLSCISMTNCTQCERGYYLFSYENVDDNFCLPCNQSCEECISYNECVCNSGKYGPSCSKDCNIPNCKSCIEVDSVVKCTECTSGYTFLNGYCISESDLCSQYCSNGCDGNQNCLGGCQDGWTGQKCTERCAGQCGKCNQNDARNCKICKEDFYTATCTLPCSLHCSALPGLSKCHINTGTCLNGCDKGYWGVTCDKTCNEGCSLELCNQLNGFCDTCNRTHYGQACQNKCSDHCVDSDASSTICYKTNGTCLHGCRDGYGGNTCELTVSTTVPLSTEKLGGQYDENDKSDSFAKIFLLGILTGVGFCLLSIVAFVAVRRIRRSHVTSTPTAVNNGFRTKQSNGSQSVRKERAYVNTAVTMQAVSCTVTECTTNNVGSSKTSDETSRSVYDSLDGDRLGDRHLYSGLERQTDHQSTSYANL